MGEKANNWWMGKKYMNIFGTIFIVASFHKFKITFKFKILKNMLEPRISRSEFYVQLCHWLDNANLSKSLTESLFLLL